MRLTIRNSLALTTQAALQELCTAAFASRLFQKDATLWGVEAEAEASVRLGWVDPFARATEVAAEAATVRAELQARGISRIVLCGMGGSSLGPEVVARAAGAPLIVLDSVHPAEVLRQLQANLRETAVIFASKSGSTIETTSHLAAFRDAFESAGLDPTDHLIIITDPGSPLAGLASEGFQVFFADPHIGGRFSVFSAFGVVPTVLAGVDFEALISQAQNVHPLLGADSEDNPALQLAASLFAAQPARYLLLLREHGPQQSGLGDWIEQLIAESTGKAGTGVLPVALPESAHEFSNLPKNAVYASLATESADTTADTEPSPADIVLHAPLAAQLLMWEVATCALGYLLGVNPFDQPDVESAKQAARSAMLRSDREEALSPLASDAHESRLIEALRDLVDADGYIAIQAFLDRDSPKAERARLLRDTLATQLGVAVSLGWGPRYLHSVGQFHKGGRPLGLFVQLIDAAPVPCGIPGRESGFETLMLAQARGDREVLEARGRQVFVRTL